MQAVPVPPPREPLPLTAHAAATPPPARMLVFADEFRLNPSRRVVPAGRLAIQVRNNGEDGHDVAVRAADGHILARTPEIAPGGLRDLGVRLTAGRYWLVCTVTGHEGHGMVTSFRVVRPARGR